MMTSVKRSKANPRKSSKRAPRNSFRYFGAKTLNPIDISEYNKLEKEAESAYKAGKKEASWAIRGVMSSLDVKGLTFNPKYKFGPTGFRPPAKWFAKMAQSSAASYFGKKLKDLTKAQAARVGKIVGGIWAKYSDSTRMKILRKYEPSAANPVQMLSCPSCGAQNPVSRSGVYLKCQKCRKNLVSVKVRRK